MPPQQTNLTSETGREVAGPGLDLSIALVKDAMGEALAAARPDPSILALRDALSEKDAAGPPAASTRIWSVAKCSITRWNSSPRWNFPRSDPKPNRLAVIWMAVASASTSAVATARPRRWLTGK